MKEGYFVMRLWQTGNIGSNNIAKVKEQPKDGFKTKSLATKWMKANIGKAVYHVSWTTYAIMQLFEPTKFEE